jgi:hypothetical protein
MTVTALDLPSEIYEKIIFSRLDIVSKARASGVCTLFYTLAWKEEHLPLSISKFITAISPTSDPKEFARNYFVLSRRSLLKKVCQFACQLELGDRKYLICRFSSNPSWFIKVKWDSRNHRGEEGASYAYSFINLYAPAFYEAPMSYKTIATRQLSNPSRTYHGHFEIPYKTIGIKVKMIFPKGPRGRMQKDCALFNKITNIVSARASRVEADHLQAKIRQYLKDKGKKICCYCLVPLIVIALWVMIIYTISCSPVTNTSGALAPLSSTAEICSHSPCPMINKGA